VAKVLEVKTVDEARVETDMETALRLLEDNGFMVTDIDMERSTATQLGHVIDKNGTIPTGAILARFVPKHEEVEEYGKEKLQSAENPPRTGKYMGRHSRGAFHFGIRLHAQVRAFLQCQNSAYAQNG
jgi:hypothetical protein